MNKLLFLLFIVSGSALSDGDYFYGRIAYGIMYNNIDHQGVKGGYKNYDSATILVGYKWKLKNLLGHKWKIKDPWYVDVQLQHNSHYFRGTPFNNKPEVSSEQLSIGLEYRIY